MDDPDQIRALYRSGMTSEEDLAFITDSNRSAVEEALRDVRNDPAASDFFAEFDLTSLGLRGVGSAKAAVGALDERYRTAREESNRAGQHTAMMMALTLFNQARWTGRNEEASLFRIWLMDRLVTSALIEEQVATVASAARESAAVRTSESL